MAVENIEAICANWVNTPVHTSLKANLKKIAADNNPWLNYYICFHRRKALLIRIARYSYYTEKKIYKFVRN